MSHCGTFAKSGSKKEKVFFFVCCWRKLLLTYVCSAGLFIRLNAANLSFCLFWRCFNFWISGVMSNRNDNVFLFYPNLLGYGRVVLALVAFEGMLYSPWRASICYFLSAFLDAFDGHLARVYNQSKFILHIRISILLCLGSRFGAMLDQLTDRCVFMGLLMTLCHLYPRAMFFLQLVAMIDIASHWLHLHATDLTGRQSHKQSTNPILHYYYTSKQVEFKSLFFKSWNLGLSYLACVLAMRHSTVCCTSIIFGPVQHCSALLQCLFCACCSSRWRLSSQLSAWCT